MPGFLPHARLPYKRRTATSVFAGYFDPLPERDVLTSLLNGVGPNKEVEAKEDVRKAKKRKDLRKRPDASPRRDTLTDLTVSQPAPPIASSSKPAPAQQELKKKKTFWTAHQGRPNIQLMPVERSVSVTPPPRHLPAHLPSDTPASRHSTSTSTSRRSSQRLQRGRSISASTSRTSSKRPRTPADDEDIEETERPQKKRKKKKKQKQKQKQKSKQNPNRKKRVAYRKGWKGWVEGSPPPSDKLINLDSVLVFEDRRTRSGKCFDAISVGTDTWV